MQYHQESTLDRAKHLPLQLLGLVQDLLLPDILARQVRFLVPLPTKRVAKHVSPAARDTCSAYVQRSAQAYSTAHLQQRRVSGD